MPLSLPDEKQAIRMRSIDPAFAAPLALRDGRPLAFGPVTRAARPVLERAMAQLSPETSRRRFFTVRYRLSDAELDALTDMDGSHRYAVGASVRDAAGAIEGVGVARYVRDARAPHIAEAAVLVVDAYQGQGIGKRLLTLLAAAARVHGIRRLGGIVLPDNDPMLALLNRHAAGVEFQRADGHLTVGVPLDGLA
jgi:GNAT superfamily N-acetyltransferase